MRALRLGAVGVVLAACTAPPPNEEDVWVDATGDLLFEQSVTFVADQCPPLAPRWPVHLHVYEEGVVTGYGPEVIGEGMGTSGWGVATVQVELEDVWGSYRPILQYELTIEPDDDVHGAGTVISTGCDAEVEVTGVQCPLGVVPCAVHDDGWNVWCDSGAVFSDDLTRFGYCLFDTSDEVCDVGGEGHARSVATCAAGCADGDLHWFETVDEYNAFDPTTLCAP